MSEQEQPPEKIQRKEAVIFLIYRKGQVLLGKRLQEVSWPNLVAPLGGHIEAFDHGQERDYKEVTVLREAKEEVGIEVTSLNYLGSLDHTIPNGDLYQSHVYLLTDWKGEPENQEEGITEIFWVNLKDAVELCPLGFCKDALKLAQAFLFQW